MSYELHVRQALSTPLEGWDFSALDGRLAEKPPSWDFRELIAPYLAKADHLLDMGTGGGEFLTSLGALPKRVTATEGYPPNIPVARRRLESLGVTVVPIAEDESTPLPLPDDTFDVIVNRHEAFDPAEIRRILVPGGVFITQQVGGDDLAELNTALGSGPTEYSNWNAGTVRRQMEEAGLSIRDSREERCPGEFRDIGAVVLFLRLTPWQIPGYRLSDFEDRLRALHERVSVEGPLPVRHHRFLIEARWDG